MRLNIFEVIFLFNDFGTQKTTQKSHHSSLKNVWNQTNLLSIFEVHVNSFDKFVI